MPASISKSALDPSGIHRLVSFIRKETITVTLYKEQVQLFPFYGDIPIYGDILIKRYKIGAKHAYFVDFSST